MLESVLVIIGGGLGSLARYWCSLGAARLWGPAFPLGTMLINIVGSLILGFLLTSSAGPTADPRLRLLLGTGFCGGFTTFSAFSVESLDLLQKGSYALAFLYVAGSLVGGLAGGFLGFVMARLSNGTNL